MSKRTFRALDNQFATVFTGPGRQDLETGRELTLWTKAGNEEAHWKTGAKTTYTNGASIEVTNISPTLKNQKGSVSKLIHCRNGDLVVIAEGDIKFKGKNIIFEAEGTSPGGSIDIVANGNISLTTNETVRISGGIVQVTSENHTLIESSGFLYLIGDIKNAGAPSAASTLAGFLGGNWAQTLQSFSNQLRGIR